MCPIYRCPIDETVFQTSRVERAPTLEGHPECPGPECRKKFGKGGAGKVVEPVPATVTPLAAADAPETNGLQPPPIGQGW